jgi:hypothetical protein
MGLAVSLQVPWDQTNIPHMVLLQLLSEDGKPILDSTGERLRAEAKFEIGRPPGVKRGTPMPVPLAINFPNVVLPAGGYRWELAIDDATLAIASFSAL